MQKKATCRVQRHRFLHQNKSIMSKLSCQLCKSSKTITHPRSESDYLLVNILCRSCLHKCQKQDLYPDPIHLLSYIEKDSPQVKSHEKFLQKLALQYMLHFDIAYPRTCGDCSSPITTSQSTIRFPIIGNPLAITVLCKECNDFHSNSELLSEYCKIIDLVKKAKF